METRYKIMTGKPRFYLCLKCEKVMMTKQAITRHVSVGTACEKHLKRKDPTTKCKVCNRSFCSRYKLSNHIKTYKGKCKELLAKKCDRCLAIFKTPYQLRRHRDGKRQCRQISEKKEVSKKVIEKKVRTELLVKYEKLKIALDANALKIENNQLKREIKILRNANKSFREKSKQHTLERNNQKKLLKKVQSQVDVIKKKIGEYPRTIISETKESKLIPEEITRDSTIDDDSEYYDFSNIDVLDEFRNFQNK